MKKIFFMIIANVLMAGTAWAHPGDAAHNMSDLVGLLFGVFGVVALYYLIRKLYDR